VHAEAVIHGRSRVQDLLSLFIASVKAPICSLTFQCKFCYRILTSLFYIKVGVIKGPNGIFYVKYE
jgi:hypothetical protein